jgi:hypothetical protein
LPIIGGSPINSIEILSEDVKRRSSIIDDVKNIFSKDKVSKSSLTINLTSGKQFSDSTSILMSLMPSTCVVNKGLLPFVVGFRNYAADLLIRQGYQQEPAGDIVISCFPKIMDCPDIVEQLAEIY